MYLRASKIVRLYTTFTRRTYVRRYRVNLYYWMKLHRQFRERKELSKCYEYNFDITRVYRNTYSNFARNGSIARMEPLRILTNQGIAAQLRNPQKRATSVAVSNFAVLRESAKLRREIATGQRNAGDYVRRRKVMRSRGRETRVANANCRFLPHVFKLNHVTPSWRARWCDV